MPNVGDVRWNMGQLEVYEYRYDTAGDPNHQYPMILDWYWASAEVEAAYVEIDPQSTSRQARPSYQQNYNPPAVGATRSNGAIKVEALGLIGGSRDGSGSKYYLGE